MLHDGCVVAGQESCFCGRKCVRSVPWVLRRPPCVRCSSAVQELSDAALAPSVVAEYYAGDGIHSAVGVVSVCGARGSELCAACSVRSGSGLLRGRAALCIYIPCPSVGWIIRVVVAAVYDELVVCSRRIGQRELDRLGCAPSGAVVCAYLDVIGACGLCAFEVVDRFRRIELCGIWKSLVPFEECSVDALCVLQELVALVAEVQCRCVVCFTVGPCHGDLVAIVHELHNLSVLAEHRDVCDVCRHCRSLV